MEQGGCRCEWSCVCLCARQTNDAAGRHARTDKRMTPMESCAHALFDELRDPKTRLPNQRPLPQLFDFTPEEVRRACPFVRVKVRRLWFKHDAARRSRAAAPGHAPTTVASALVPKRWRWMECLKAECLCCLMPACLCCLLSSMPVPSP